MKSMLDGYRLSLKFVCKITRIDELHHKIMKKSAQNLTPVVFIILGSALLLFNFVSDNDNVFVQILGLASLMYGAFRASSHWAAHKDDHLDQDEL